MAGTGGSAGKYCEGKIKMASEKVSRKKVLEIKYVMEITPLYTPKTLNFCWI